MGVAWGIFGGCAGRHLGVRKVEKKACVVRWSMMKSRAAVGSVYCLLLAMSLWGCGSRAEHLNREKLLLLELGISKDKAIAMMGMPIYTEAHRGEDEAMVEILYFDTSRFGNGVYSPECSSRGDCVPLIFEDDRLAGWGDAFYQSRR